MIAQFLSEKLFLESIELFKTTLQSNIARSRARSPVSGETSARNFRVGLSERFGKILIANLSEDPPSDYPSLPNGVERNQHCANNHERSFDQHSKPDTGELCVDEVAGTAFK